MTAIPTTEPAHAERSHHPTSPSSLQTREASACWVNRNESSEAAERGTKQHQSADSGQDDHELTDAEYLAVEATHIMVDQAVQRLGPDAIAIREAYWHVDDRVIVAEDGSKWVGTSGGFADVVVISSDWTRAAVIDFKFGKWSVEPAENNLQGIAYALGVFHEAKLRGHNMREVCVEFFSPHIGETSSHTFKSEEVPKLLLRVVAAAERAKDILGRIKKDPTDLTNYTTSTSACTFCGRIGWCPAIAKIGFQLGKKYQQIDVEKIESDVRGLDLSDPAVAHAGLQLWAILGKAAAEYRKRVTERAIDQQEFIPKGYTLTVSYPREIQNLDKAIEISEQYLPKDVVHGMLSLPITTVEKEVSKRAERGHKERTVEEFAQKLEASGAVVARSTPTVVLRMKTEK